MQADSPRKPKPDPKAEALRRNLARRRLQAKNQAQAPQEGCARPPGDLPLPPNPGES
jgi:hypothetical protein